MLVYFNRKNKRLLLPKFHHDNRTKNFLKTPKYVGKWDVIDKVNFSEFPDELGRQLYIYEKTSTEPRTISLSIVDVDWPMPDKYFRTIRATVRGFSFLFPKASKTIKDNFIPANNLLNTESGTEEIANVIKSADFFPEEKQIKEKIAEYNAVPIR